MRETIVLRAPASWPEPLVAAVAMLLLAAIDLAAAYVTKEAVLRRSPMWSGVGVALFLLLFYVFASSLQYADLALVTLGWVVVLQVGVVLLDRFRYGAALGTDKWVAVAVILVAQAYLLLAPTRVPQSAAAEERPGSATGQTVVDLGAATHPVITR